MNHLPTHILVVEDNCINHLKLPCSLEQQGYIVAMKMCRELEKLGKVETTYEEIKTVLQTIR